MRLLGKAAALSCSLAACSFSAQVSSQGNGDDAAPPIFDAGDPADAPVAPPTDAGMLPDADPSCVPSDVLGFVPSNIDPCQLPPSNGNATIDGNLLVNTNTNLLTGEARSQTGGPDLLVVVYDSLIVNGNITITGTRPLVIVSLGDITLNGRMVWQRRPSLFVDPFVNANCGSGVGSMGITESAPNGPFGVGGGGGGGAYGAPGGIGGEGRGNNGNGDAPGGDANGDNDLSPLRSGCSGGIGAGPSNSSSGGVGGVGGGGLQLVAGGTLTINSNGGVAVPGQGGRGAVSPPSSGGGGGGSGGAILVETGADIIVNGFLTALGGGGGAGVQALSGFGVNGDRGQTEVNQPASGGEGSGGDGGDGGFGDSAGDQAGKDGSAGTTNTRPSSGGGGGGGGVGRIHLRASGNITINGSAVIAPSPQ